jgi:hypothetical protein
MSNAGSYRINTPAIAHQTIDGEVVLINMETGCYYSLQQSGAEVWQLLEAGADAEAMTTQLGRRYQAEAGQIAAAVEKLLAELQQEAVIVPEPGPAAAASLNNGTSAEASGKPFAPPVFQKFTDMQDLLLLDPIHEVADTGWPNPKDAPQ